jgi:hypothetical protein
MRIPSLASVLSLSLTCASSFALCANAALGGWVGPHQPAFRDKYGVGVTDMSSRTTSWASDSTSAGARLGEPVTDIHNVSRISGVFVRGRWMSVTETEVDQ